MAWEALPIYGPAWVLIYKGCDDGEIIRTRDPGEARTQAATLNRLAARGPEVLALLKTIAEHVYVPRDVCDKLDSLIAQAEGNA